MNTENEQTQTFRFFVSIFWPSSLLKSGIIYRVWHFGKVQKDEPNSSKDWKPFFIFWYLKKPEDTMPSDQNPFRARQTYKFFSWRMLQFFGAIKCSLKNELCSLISYVRKLCKILKTHKVLFYSLNSSTEHLMAINIKLFLAELRVYKSRTRIQKFFVGFHSGIW